MPHLGELLWKVFLGLAHWEGMLLCWDNVETGETWRQGLGRAGLTAQPFEEHRAPLLSGAQPVNLLE